MINTIRSELFIDPKAKGIESKLLKEYWELENGNFVNKPSHLAKKYEISMRVLNKLVKDYSYRVLIQGHCIRCEKKIEETVYTQSDFREKRNNHQTFCLLHSLELYKERRLDEIRKLELKNFVLADKFIEAVLMRKWEVLPTDVLEVLKDIVRLKEKKLIYQKVFHGNHTDKSIWKKVDVLEKQGFIYIEREGYSIVRFYFPTMLQTILWGN